MTLAGPLLSYPLLSGLLPPVTELHRFDEQLIKEVILYEMARNGQVFFIHNRVETIDQTAAAIKKRIPAAEVGVVGGAEA